MKTYTHMKGCHTSLLWGLWPVIPRIVRKPRRVILDGVFLLSSGYHLPGADQRDWNKLGGVSFDLTTNHADSAMIGWRWNPEVQSFQLCAYCHIDSRRVIVKMGQPLGGSGYDAEVLLNAPVGIPYRAEIEIHETGYRFTATLSNNPHTSEVDVEAKAEKKWAKTIGPWFGGNNPAPVRVNIRLKREIR